MSEDNHSDRDVKAERIAEALEAIAKNLGSPQSVSKTERSKFYIDIISMLGLWVAAGVAVWAIISSGDDATQQRGQMIAAERPWLMINEAATEEIVVGPAKDHNSDWPSVYDGLPKGKFTIGVDLALQNVGHSPARNLHLYAEVFSSSHKGLAYHENCASTKEDPQFPGQVLFPNAGPIRQHVEAVGDTDDLKKAVLRAGKEIYYVGVCLTYRSSTTDQYYHTFKMYIMLPSHDPAVMNSAKGQLWKAEMDQGASTGTLVPVESVHLAFTDLSDYAD